MSIAIVCNLSDGVIIGADSAITITASTGETPGVQDVIAKVYNEAEKVFGLADLPVGLVNYGVAILERRSIGSYIEEFVATEIEKRKEEFQKMTVAEIGKEIGDFFTKKYEITFGETTRKPNVKSNTDSESIRIPVLGLVLAGFSYDAYLSEVIDISIPLILPSKEPIILRKQGNFGSNWFGNYMPITRVIKGNDPGMLNSIIDYFVKEKGVEFTDEVKTKLENIVKRYENVIPYAAMPIKEGIEHVKFLLNSVIGHQKWVIGAPVCGGSINVGVIKRNRTLEFFSD